MRGIDELYNRNLLLLKGHQISLGCWKSLSGGRFGASKPHGVERGSPYNLGSGRRRPTTSPLIRWEVHFRAIQSHLGLHRMFIRSPGDTHCQLYM